LTAWRDQFFVASFLHKDDYPPLGDGREALLKHFEVPMFVANRACTVLNGYFGCRASYDDQKELTACSKLFPAPFSSSRLRGLGTWFRCLVKMVRKELEKTSEDEQEYVKSEKDKKKGYVWFELGIFTIWNESTCRVLCVVTPDDLPIRLEEALNKRPSPVEFRDPFAMHADLLDQIVLYYEISAWRVRDPVRKLEEVSRQQSYG
jgi:hypothetical protein